MTALILKGKHNSVGLDNFYLVVVTALILKGKHNRKSLTEITVADIEKKIKSSLGKSEIKVPKMESRFSVCMSFQKDTILRFRKCYYFMLREWSVSNIEEPIKKQYNFEISTSVITNVTASKVVV